MSLEPSETFDPLEQHTRARRRRASRMLTQLRADERETFLCRAPPGDKQGSRAQFWYFRMFARRRVEEIFETPT